MDLTLKFHLNFLITKFNIKNKFVGIVLNEIQTQDISFNFEKFEKTKYD